MKYTAILVILVFGFFSSARAQSPAMGAAQDIKLGPMFMPGVSANAGSVTNGTKTDAADFSWALGAQADIPFSPSAGLLVGLCYDNRSVGFHDQKTSDTSIGYTFSYFSLRPELRIGDFLVGVGLGIPVGASANPNSDATATKQNTQPSLGASSMNFLVEGRIGASIPITEMSNGSELRFLVSASYAFSQIVSSSFAPLKPNDNNTSNATDNNGPIATLQLGFSYLFDLTPH